MEALEQRIQEAVAAVHVTTAALKTMAETGDLVLLLLLTQTLSPHQHQ
jgi:hypothetical protein